MRNTIFIIMIGFFMGACGGPTNPKSIKEFRTAVSEQSSVIRNTEVKVINRSFSKVFRDVSRYGRECMTLTMKSTRQGIFWDTDLGTYSYSTMSIKTGKNKGYAVLLIGDKEFGGDKLPTEKAWYLVVADMEAVKGGKTRLTMNGVYRGSEPYRAIAATAEGRKYRTCPPHFY